MPKRDPGALHQARADLPTPSPLLCSALLLRRHDNDRHLGLVPHCLDGAPVNDITDESMSVRRQGNEIDLLVIREFENLGRGAAEAESRGDSESRLAAEL